MMPANGRWDLIRRLKINIAPCIPSSLFSYYISFHPFLFLFLHSSFVYLSHFSTFCPIFSILSLSFPLLSLYSCPFFLHLSACCTFIHTKTALSSLSTRSLTNVAKCLCHIVSCTTQCTSDSPQRPLRLLYLSLAYRPQFYAVNCAVRSVVK